MQRVATERSKPLFCFVYTVPYAAPSNVQAQLLENSTILLTWEPPPKELHNGQLIGYTVSLALKYTL